MAGFSELIKNFDKIRYYMRDFYIFGVKSRGQFRKKAPRTYDNEKRRIESYVGDFMKWEYKGKEKRTFISIDSSEISVNPFYNAWKAKSFTSNDIMLHFYIIDLLKQNEELTVKEITEKINSNILFDPQTVRLKCIEYEKEGIFVIRKIGKSVYYRLSDVYFNNFCKEMPFIEDMIKFFQGQEFFGEIGSYIMDNEGIENNLFSFKHKYIVHTLDDESLFKILNAIRDNKNLILDIGKYKRTIIKVFPVKIIVSHTTGRQYLCVYNNKNRFVSKRIDYINSIEISDINNEASSIKANFEKNKNLIWGISFEGEKRIEKISIKLCIDEKKEDYIIKRILRVGRGGELTKISENTFLYEKECFDLNEMIPWLRTLIGRIISIETNNQNIKNKFYEDFNEMYKLYYDEEK